MSNEKMSDDELIEALNQGMSQRAIAEKYGYSREQSVSERISKLKDEGYEFRDTTSEASQGAGVQVGISYDILEELGFEGFEEEALYYMRSPQDDRVMIVVREDPVPEALKFSRLNDDGDRMVYITGGQLRALGYESNENLFVEKDPVVQENVIELKFSQRRVKEP